MDSGRQKLDLTVKMSQLEKVSAGGSLGEGRGWAAGDPVTVSGRLTFEPRAAGPFTWGRGCTARLGRDSEGP